MGGKVTKGKSSMNTPIISKNVQVKKSSSRKIVQVTNSRGNSPRETTGGSSHSLHSLHSTPRGGSDTDRIKISSNVTASGFNPTRISNKKQKIIITAKASGTSQKKEQTEVDVLKVVKKNNHEFDDEKLISNCLMTHFFMKSLEKEARREIVKEMTLCRVDKDDVLFKQGTNGNYFYIVKEGEFDLLINDKLVKQLCTGDNFGELALLHSAPRSGTVVAKVDSLVYCLERRNFRKIVDHINSLNYEENRKFLNNIPILSHIENDLKSILASQLMKEEYDRGVYVVKEGDMANCMYIIKEGEVECSIGGKVFRNLKKGDHFGEKSILMKSTRTMDVVTFTPSVIYSISVDTLKNMAGDRYKDVLFLNFIKMSFQQSKFFTKINMKLLENAYECFAVYNFKAGETVIKTGYPLASKVIIVIEGNIINKKINQAIAKRGDILFEDYLSTLSKDKSPTDLIADPDCLTVETSTNDFIKILGGTNSFKELLKKSNCLDSLYKIPLFKNFTQKKMELLSGMVTVQKFENGKKIIVQGETDDKFYIVKNGKVDIFINSNYIRTLNVFESFGDRALFFNEPRTATAQANGTVELYVIQAKDFKAILEDNLADYLKNRFYLQDNSIELKDLDFVKELGQGNFGSVVLVRHRRNKYEYAAKSICKKQIDCEQLHVNLDLERSILLKIDHPFIVKLVKTMKSEKFIFFLMEYIRGKELFDVIRDIGLLTKAQTQFYGASLMMAIDFLHERKCIYRDIKPENVMVCENVSF